MSRGLRAPTASVASCHGDQWQPVPTGGRVIALVGSPNVGKSTLFNALTGARRSVGNWPGTTVEVGRGPWAVPGAGTVALVDLPGAYSLDPISPDEALTRALLVEVPPEERPDLVVVVVSAADLGRSLYLVSQVREYGLPFVVALTMIDVARRRGLVLDVDTLSRRLGAPVAELAPRRRGGADALAGAVSQALDADRARAVTAVLGEVPPTDPEDDLVAAERRFAWVSAVVSASVRRDPGGRAAISDRIDRVVTSPVIGPLLFLGVMWLVFQLTTTVAAPVQQGLGDLVSGPVTDAVTTLLRWCGAGSGWLRGLLVDGLVNGVGMVLTFVPLMAIMFALLALLEDSGYLARAAVVTDRLMRTVGLPGRAFLPLIVGFGCNVPAISATRVLPDARHRLMTALLVPFTSCSARLTVYVLVASTFFGSSAGDVVFLMYVVSVLLVVLGGLLLRSTLLRAFGDEPLVLDLPRYQAPVPRLLLVATWTRLAAFLRTAGGVIVLTVTAVWLLSAVPVSSVSGSFAHVPVRDSAFGAAASLAAPVFDPAGFGDWHAAGALLVGGVAKEAVVSSWAQTYAAQEPGDLHDPGALGTALRSDFARSSGGHSGPAALAFLVFLLAYTPCLATITAQLREIGLRWTLVGMAGQLGVAWVLAVLVFQVGRWLA